MKIKVRFNIFTFLILIPMLIISKPIDEKLAAVVAKTFLTSKVHHQKPELICKVSDVIPFRENDHTLYYIVNFSHNGFVLVVADDRFYPILAWSVSDIFVESDVPENVSHWLKWYTDQIEYGLDHPELCNDAEVSQAWGNLKSGNLADNPDRERGCAPLLTSRWDQTRYYNAYCPADPGGFNGHTPVGCVATAMAQLLYYYRFPQHGNGENSYTPSYGNGVYGVQNVDFGNTAYHWDEMIDKCYESNSAVAELCYHCGVSVNMAYSPQSSGAGTEDVPDALINNFNYSPSAEFFYRADFGSSQDWTDMLIQHLDNNQPLIYRSTLGWSGHAYVCDGYQDSTHFHFNWGWAGTYNGYYFIDELILGGMDLTFGQGAVFGIYPDTTQFVYPGYCQGNQILSSTIGSFQDGSGPDDYPNNSSCAWLIQPEDAEITNILLDFSQFKTETDRDIVTVYDGETVEANLLGTFSGDQLPEGIHSSGDAILVEFSTDDSICHAGWHANFQGYSLPFCDGIYLADSTEGMLEDGSRQFDYSNNMDCKWLIAPETAPYDSVGRIHLYFSEFGLAAGDTLYVFDGMDETMTLLGKYTGFVRPDEIISSSNRVFLRFVTDDNSTGNGWGIYYLSLDPVYCQNTVYLTGLSGIIEDGSEAKHYVENSDCSWLIDVEGATFIMIDFLEVDMELNYDYLNIIDPINPTQLIEKITGYGVPEPVIVPSNQVLLKFHTDYTDNLDGFSLKYHASLNSVIDQSTNQNIFVYPNPVDTDLFVVNAGFTFDKMHVEILNSSGMKVLDSYLSSPDKSVNVQCLTGGFYLVKLVSGSEVYYSKFVKN